MHENDSDLMRRLQAGDLKAFEELVRRWQQPMARFLSRLTGAEEAADLCQELFLRLFEKRYRYRENGTFRPWLYQIALNLARDEGRRARRAPVALQNHDVPEPTWKIVSPCEEQDVAALVQSALGELEERLRQVLVLRHYEAMNFEEMARVLATPASTLKSRFAVALKRLRARLKEKGLIDFNSEETVG